jgi:hypothetical protein
MKDILICALHLILLRLLNKGGWNLWDMQNARGDETCVHNFYRKYQKMDSFWTPRRRLEYNIKLDPKRTRCEGIDWIYLTQAILTFWVQERDLDQISVNCSGKTMYHALRITFPFLLSCLSFLRTLIKLELDTENTNKPFNYTFHNYSVVSRWQICNVIASDTCDLQV